MINMKNVKRFCKGDYTQIENYEEAVADNSQTWYIHHRDEIRILPSGMVAVRSAAELKENGRYFKCPANELIFLTRKDHVALHAPYINKRLGSKHTDDTRKKMSQSHYAGTYSDFYTKFKLHHVGKTCKTDQKLYNYEYHYFKKTGKCRWEVNDA